jgi:hypothetical protein
MVSLSVDGLVELEMIFGFGLLVIVSVKHLNNVIGIFATVAHHV